MQKIYFKEQSSIDLTSLQIKGDRILLQSINEKYSSKIFKEFTSEITRYMYPKPNKNIDEVKSFISMSLKGMQEGRELTLAITELKKKEFLGVCSLHGNENPKIPELGIWIKKDAHGKKFGREAIITLTSWAFRHINFDYLIYPVDKANIASRKIPETLGGIIFEERKVKTMNGNYLDEVVYKISNNWQKANNNSLKRI
jgi:RimJ/RimL family protein N-acetyltransferase